MKDYRSKPASSRGKAAALVLTGFLAGAAVMFLFSDGRFSRIESAVPQSSAGENAVTFGGASASKGSQADALTKLLESGRASGLDRTREIFAFVDKVKPGEFEARITEILSRREGGQGFDLIESLYRKWAGVDADAAIAHAQTLTGKDRQAALGGALPEWAAKEPHEALAWIEMNDWNRDFQSVLYVSLRTMADRNPEEAVALVEASSYLKNSAASVRMDGTSFEIPWFVYAVWAKKDVEAATARVLSIRDVRDRTNILNTLARHMARRDPDSAWEWANQLERSVDRHAAMEEVVRSRAWDGKISEAISLFETMPPGLSRSNVLGAITGVLSESNPKEAFEFIESHALGSQVGESYQRIFRCWAKTDPSGALAAIQNRMGPGNDQKTALHSLFAVVSNEDPLLAREMLKGLAPDHMQRAVSLVAGAQARQDPGAAFVWVSELTDPESKKAALSAVFEQWSRVAPEEACASGLKLEDPTLRGQCVNIALRQWSHGDAAEAMAWAVENLEVPDRDHLIPSSLLRTWVNQDLDSAKEWVIALPPGKLRDECISQLAMQWAQYDAAAAGQWLNRLPPGDMRDRAVQFYAGRVYEPDPEAALAWAESIANPSLRRSQVEDIVRRYLADAPEKAKRWIAGSSLSPDRQAALLREAKQQ